MSTPFELVAYTLNHFQPDIPVYRENQKDGTLKFPSFFVQQLATQAHGKVSDEQIRRYNFDVVYLVDHTLQIGSETPLHQIDKMSELALSELEWLVNEDGKPVSGLKNLSTEIQNGDLHIFFSFVTRMGKEDEGTKMASMQQKGELNG
ncbi:phage tail terminator family protein [Fructobacillus tropaeoli]|uniref:Phage protein n=1 Tax=Fructobacillus tropaeoli TaxID=709323 RepID=A0A3F3H3G3_9LACO|nr:hypothetical protein [Fructobacillus tropaeoli]GAP04886.1 hypothetical protein FTRO_0110210 [Fructobacillus tropaeoli]